MTVLAAHALSLAEAASTSTCVPAYVWKGSEAVNASSARTVTLVFTKLLFSVPFFKEKLTIR